MTPADTAPLIGLYLIAIVVLMRNPLRLIGFVMAILLANGSLLAFWLVVDLTLVASIIASLQKAEESDFVRYSLLVLALVSTAMAAVVDGQAGVVSMLAGLMVLAYTVEPRRPRPSRSRSIR